MHESAGNTPILTTPEQLGGQNTLDHPTSSHGAPAETYAETSLGHSAAAMGGPHPGQRGEGWHGPHAHA